MSLKGNEATTTKCNTHPANINNKKKVFFLLTAACFSSHLIFVSISVLIVPIENNGSEMKISFFLTSFCLFIYSFLFLSSSSSASSPCINIYIHPWRWNEWKNYRKWIIKAHLLGRFHLKGLLLWLFLLWI